MTFEEIVRAIDEIEVRLRKDPDNVERIMLRKARRDLWINLMSNADQECVQ